MLPLDDHAFPEACPAHGRPPSPTSPIIISSITAHCPSLTLAGSSKVDVISPPAQAAGHVACGSRWGSVRREALPRRGGIRAVQTVHLQGECRVCGTFWQAERATQCFATGVTAGHACTIAALSPYSLAAQHQQERSNTLLCSSAQTRACSTHPSPAPAARCRQSLHAQWPSHRHPQTAAPGSCR